MSYDVNETALHYSQNPEELSQLIYKIGLLVAENTDAEEFDIEATGDFWDDEREFKATLKGEIVTEVPE